ncbi:glycosyltransferase [Kibdelosporangium phytohabitans]|uniref:Glycosyltransferase n=1 Tax=Kibdelosporangium phytohabitans TaxID=860235 RepID=A0A0N9I1R6_9PSEU|nr:glycosyltransferase [Kibdelosporangium phytohabitans]ALG11518.1 glycosyltransferase [Kibdelosporangium phytohabitans]MBE1462875.1 GT2 family glycosyltransferase/glycosyltransferase involved in cell wall biosynthesis [Kibdelosporangium phytohabitans]
MTALWGISFDATPISGVVVEFVKTAKHFADRDRRVVLDLGYDIKADKGAFFRPYTDESRLLPDWVDLGRIGGVEEIPGYDSDFVAEVLREVVGRGSAPHLLPRIDAVAAQLSDLIVETWEAHDVSTVMVENGTLPENITYTKALHLAIEKYGARRNLGRYVLWRDHDLMWQSEPSSGKYGVYPYPATPKPPNSPHIHYLALHEQARGKTLEWAHLRAVDVLPNAFTHRKATVHDGNADFRREHGIPADAPLIARCTRVIRQKRIDRDLHLLAAIPDAYLFVAGDTGESAEEHRRLTSLAADLGVTDRVVFGGWLAPHEDDVGRSTGSRYSVRDLLAHADLASFLTSYDYESYGNPVGEAIASGVPYMSTRYELYDTVYGSKGFRAPLLTEDIPDACFVRQVRDLLADDEKRAQMAEHNFQLGERGSRTAKDLLDRLVLTPMDPRVRLSVVLPVYNEAANLPWVLESLYQQRGLDRSTYEVVLVDNNSTDDTVDVVNAFIAEHPDLAVHIVAEPEQGVSCARRTGMRFASERSRGRVNAEERFYLVSADADCRVDEDWLFELFTAMESGKAAIAVCDYHYSAEHFAGRPRLWDAITKTLRCRAVTFALFGGFPDGKGFAVDRDVHDRVGGIEIFYQLRDGEFVNHLSDDWDFGITVRGSGEDIGYAPKARVEINPRRVDHAIDEVITGRAYGSDGIIVMRDIRPETTAVAADLTEDQARQAWEFSIKDFTPKNTILPVLLTPSLLDDDAVIEFFTPSLAERLGKRIAEIKDEMRMTDFTPIHSYKTPSYRLYFEFADEIFARLRAAVGEDIGHPPPLPPCLRDVPPDRFAEFVKYYCEDRESGEAHNYFGNGGVF